MALIQCSECGHQVSDKASACPSCGYPIDNANNEDKYKTIDKTVNEIIENVSTVNNQGNKTKEDNTLDSFTHRLLGVGRLLLVGTGIAFVLMFLFRPDSRGMAGFVLMIIAYNPLLARKSTDSKNRTIYMWVTYFIIIVGLVFIHQTR